MRIAQLQEFLANLIANGIDPNTPICIHAGDPPDEAFEVDDAYLLKGKFREDPSPKMCAFRPHEGTFLMLTTSLDYDALVNDLPTSLQRLDMPIDTPAKTWPNGHWFVEPRRQPGQL